jgi:hypothetical protein
VIVSPTHLKSAVSWSWELWHTILKLSRATTVVTDWSLTVIFSQVQHGDQVVPNDSSESRLSMDSTEDQIMSCRGCFFRGFGLFETRLRKDRNQNYMIKSQYPLNRLPLHSRLYSPFAPVRILLIQLSLSYSGNVIAAHTTSLILHFSTSSQCLRRSSDSLDEGSINSHAIAPRSYEFAGLMASSRNYLTFYRLAACTKLPHIYHLLPLRLVTRS